MPPTFIKNVHSAPAIAADKFTGIWKEMFVLYLYGNRTRGIIQMVEDFIIVARDKRFHRISTQRVCAYTHTRINSTIATCYIIYALAGRRRYLVQLCSRFLRVCVQYKHIRPCFYCLPGFWMQPTVTTEHSKRGQRRVVFIQLNQVFLPLTQPNEWKDYRTNIIKSDSTTNRSRCYKFCRKRGQLFVRSKKSSLFVLYVVFYSRLLVKILSRNLSNIRLIIFSCV